MMELIDRVKLESMTQAEAKWSKFFMGEIDFLEDLNMIKGRKLCWQMIVRKWSREKECSKKICRLAKVVGIVGNPLHMSIMLREAKRSFKAADEEYHEL
jgi:hypothetical protein